MGTDRLRKLKEEGKIEKYVKKKKSPGKDGKERMG